MNEVASHLVDSVLPHVAIRQWVLSLPFSVRYLLSYNPLLVTKVLSIFMRVVSNWYEKAGRKNGVVGKTGAITFVQRSGSAANLNVHYHSLFVDGVYAIKNDKPVFIPVFPPSDDEIAVLVHRINVRVRRFLERRGFELTDFSEDPFAHEQPVFSEIVGASIQSRGALGERAGKKVRRIGTGVTIGDVFIVGKRCAVSDGFSLHANVQIKSDERGALEKLVRYTARPPLALERMSETPDGKILYKLKSSYSDGTTHILFDRMELVEKVIALIPPPRANLLRYHGIFGANSKIRKLIVPEVKEKKEGEGAPNKKKWAELLKRSFAIDILQCSACNGKMRVIATIKDPLVIRKILEHLGLSFEPPKRMPPRAPPQMEMYSSDDNLSQTIPDYDAF